VDSTILKFANTFYSEQVSCGVNAQTNSSGIPLLSVKTDRYSMNIRSFEGYTLLN